MDLRQAQIEAAQRLLCKECQVEYVASPAHSKTGFAIATRGQLPVNGLRHPVVGTTSGWYIWCGEQFSEDPDFFAPRHTQHIYEDFPEVAEFLGLPPG